MRLLKKLLLASFVAALVLVGHAAPAKAYSNENMIDNAVFDNKDAMNEAQIRSFIQSRPNTCLTRTGAGLGGGNIFDEPTDYFTYGPNKVDAARVIYQAAQYNEINPRVILATLQKEQSMLTDSDCYTDAPSLNKAMGYACYEGASACPATWAAGFERQVMKGAWQLAFDRQRAEGNTSWGGNDSINYGGRMTEGNRKRCGSCALIYYDGYSVIDGVNTKVLNGATASLYNYTPHRGQSFPYWFEQFFGTGSTSAVAYQWQVAGQRVKKYATGEDIDITSGVPAGERIVFYIQARNTGAATWSSSGANPVRVATARGDDRTSLFCEVSWIACHRPVVLSEPSVAPGEIGTFQFAVQAPLNPGTYNEYFNLLAEGLTRMNDIGLFFTVKVNAANTTSTLVSSTLPSSLNPGATASGTLTIRNDGDLTWYNVAKYPVRLGTASPYDRSSQFRDTSWLASTRISEQNEFMVRPGQSGNFPITIKAPATPGVYQESFSLLAEGYKWFGPLPSTTITVNGQAPQVTDRLTSGQRLNPGQSIQSGDGRYKLFLQGDGNLVLYSPSRALWSTGTQGRSPGFLVMQGDGNLVLYGSQGQVNWASWTQGRAGVSLIMQGDGNLVLYDSQYRPLWNTRTAGL